MPKPGKWSDRGGLFKQVCFLQADLFFEHMCLIQTDVLAESRCAFFKQVDVLFFQAYLLSSSSCVLFKKTCDFQADVLSSSRCAYSNTSVLIEQKVFRSLRFVA